MKKQTNLQTGSCVTRMAQNDGCFGETKNKWSMGFVIHCNVMCFLVSYYGFAIFFFSLWASVDTLQKQIDTSNANRIGGGLLTARQFVNHMQTEALRIQLLRLLKSIENDIENQENRDLNNANQQQQQQPPPPPPASPPPPQQQQRLSISDNEPSINHNNVNDIEMKEQCDLQPPRGNCFVVYVLC